jgi:MFS family permease
MVRPTRVRYVAAAVPVIQKELGFSLVTMGWILSAFRWGYALFQIPGGWLGDRIGPRRALSLRSMHIRSGDAVCGTQSR